MNELSGDRAQLATTEVGALSVNGTGVGVAAGLCYANAANWPADQSEADYLTLSNASKADLATAIGAEVGRTIAFWLYCYAGSTTAAQYRNIWMNGGDRWTGGESIRINQEPRVWCMFGDGAGLSGHSGGSCHGPVVNMNVWELWIVQQDPVANTYTIYKYPASGIEQQHETLAWPYGQAANGSAINICNSGSNGNATHRLGPLMVWNRVLTSAERLELWNGGTGMTYAQIIGVS